MEKMEKIEKNLWKYTILLTTGLFLMGSAVLFYILKNYPLVIGCGFGGLMLTKYCWRYKKCLLKAKSAIKAGLDFIIINYQNERTKNVSDIKIIPVFTDKFTLYGYIPEKGDIDEFLWRHMMGATINGEKMYVVDVLKYIRDIPTLEDVNKA